MSAVGSADLGEHLRELELELLRPGTRRTPAQLALLLADEFREFGSSGKVYTKDAVIEALQKESPLQIEISNFEARQIGPGVALVTYDAVKRDRRDGSETASLRSSLWVLRDGRWQTLFHQGTIRLRAGLGSKL